MTARLSKQEVAFCQSNITSLKYSNRTLMFVAMEYGDRVKGLVSHASKAYEETAWAIEKLEKMLQKHRQSGGGLYIEHGTASASPRKKKGGAQ